NEQGEVEQIFLMVSRLPELANSFRTANGEVYLVNDQGFVLFGPSGSEASYLTEKMSTDLLADSRETSSGTKEVKSNHGKDILASYSKANFGELTAVSLVDRHEALRAVDVVIRRSIVFFILLVSASTIVSLIPRFYDVSAGRVLVDGRDVRDYDQKALRRAIGIAQQETVLFSGSIADNIRYGRPDASDAQVIAAAQAAQAHDFIQNLPDGYDTQVGARGVNLSGGQKQRIAIARALLIDPAVLILDDSTSAVDVETEARIQDVLEHSKGRRTSLVIAQRISTVLNADKILVLENGQIAAQGSHRELLANSPIYQDIYNSQLGGGEVNRE
nr:ATP-binding cassette domain-containing protein [Anaerolinea sp.]